MEDLMDNSIRITGGYNVSFFEILGGDDIDSDNDSIVDNFYSVESNNFSLVFLMLLVLRLRLILRTISD
ncbi:MAG: hypothetical protein IPL53_20675 [Ignavibacteria bacterium]|nr:hypothetical protein [Ignavibacteria bacterium]